MHAGRAFAERVYVGARDSLDFCVPPLSTRVSWSYVVFRCSDDETRASTLHFQGSRQPMFVFVLVLLLAFVSQSATGMTWSYLVFSLL